MSVHTAIAAVLTNRLFRRQPQAKRSHFTIVHSSLRKAKLYLSHITFARTTNRYRRQPTTNGQLYLAQKTVTAQGTSRPSPYTKHAQRILIFSKASKEGKEGDHIFDL